MAASSSARFPPAPSPVGFLSGCCPVRPPMARTNAAQPVIRTQVECFMAFHSERNPTPPLFQSRRGHSLVLRSPLCPHARRGEKVGPAESGTRCSATRSLHYVL